VVLFVVAWAGMLVCESSMSVVKVVVLLMVSSVSIWWLILILVVFRFWMNWLYVMLLVWAVVLICWIYS